MAIKRETGELTGCANLFFLALVLSFVLPILFGLLYLIWRVIDPIFHALQ